VLWPGQFVNVDARLNVEHDRILVPSSTVENGPQGKYVWVLDKANNTVAMRPVNVLRNWKPAKQVEQAVIAGGLKPGEMVITEGQMRLMPGGKVRLLDNKSTTQVGEAEHGTQSAGGAS
jgi:multidrug efflux system membrane fusion protein